MECDIIRLVYEYMKEIIMGSIFLDCFNNTGKKYLRVVEGYYFKGENGKATVKRRTIKNLGPLSRFDDGQGEEDLLIRLRAQFKEKTLDIGMTYDDLESKDKRPRIRNIEENLRLKNIGYFFLESMFNKLGISDVLRQYKSDHSLGYDILGLSKLLVFGRILDPKSKKATFERRDCYLFDVTTSSKIAEVYKTLDVLNEISESVQKRMNTKIKQSSIGRISELTYYDVTNYYFETMYGDDDVLDLDAEGKPKLDKKGKPIILEKGLRKKGVSKKYVPNPLVAMGLFIDRNGLPVSYSIFPGNTQDKTSFKEVIKKTINTTDLGRIIVVADNGMYAQENMYLLVSKGNGYIVSKSVKKHWNTKPAKTEEASLKDWALNEADYTCKYQNGVMISKTKSRVYERTLKDSDGNAITIKEKQVIFWSRKHYEKELHQNRKFVEYLESCKEHPDKLKDRQRKSQEFIKVLQVDKKTGEIVKTKPLVILLEDKIVKYKETMGFYSIVTSEVEMADSEVKNRYHGLSRIEDSFRIIGSDLEGRPIYVWTAEHINAHFLICFIALTIIRLFQHKVLKYQGKDTLNTDGWEQGLSSQKLQEALGDFQASHVGDGFYQTTAVKDDLALILRSLGFNETLFLPSINLLSSYKDKAASLRL
jgi:transposase